MHDNTVFHRVARFALTLDMERDCWMKGSLLTALLESGDASLIESAQNILERAVTTQTSEGHLNYYDVLRYGAGHIVEQVPVAHGASIGYPLLLLYEQVGNERYLHAAQRQADAILAAPRSHDGGISQVGARIELWIDYAYLLVPFLAKLGTITDQPNLVDEAYHQLEVHLHHLWDREYNLARHAWSEVPNYFPQSAFWSRGNGWLAAGLVDLLSIAPVHPGADAAKKTLTRLIRALASYQDASGYWRNVVDDPLEPLETSGTLMHAYAFASAVEQKLAERAVLEDAKRAFSVVVGGVDDSGAVSGVALPPGGPTVPLGVAPFGQGFFLLTWLVLQRLEPRAMSQGELDAQ